MEDFRSRIDLGILWLYQEYVKAESQSPGSSMNENSQYALCLNSLLKGMRRCLEPRDKYVSSSLDGRLSALPSIIFYESRQKVDFL